MDKIIGTNLYVPLGYEQSNDGTLYRRYSNPEKQYVRYTIIGVRNEDDKFRVSYVQTFIPINPYYKGKPTETFGSVVLTENQIKRFSKKPKNLKPFQNYVD